MDNITNPTDYQQYQQFLGALLPQVKEHPLPWICRLEIRVWIIRDDNGDFVASFGDGDLAKAMISSAEQVNETIRPTKPRFAWDD